MRLSMAQFLQDKLLNPIGGSYSAAFIYGDWRRVDGLSHLHAAPLSMVATPLYRATS